MHEYSVLVPDSNPSMQCRLRSDAFREFTQVPFRNALVGSLCPLRDVVQRDFQLRLACYRASGDGDHRSRCPPYAGLGATNGRCAQQKFDPRPRQSIRLTCHFRQGGKGLLIIYFLQSMSEEWWKRANVLHYSALIIYIHQLQAYWGPPYSFR